MDRPRDEIKWVEPIFNSISQDEVVKYPETNTSIMWNTTFGNLSIK